MVKKNYRKLKIYLLLFVIHIFCSLFNRNKSLYIIFYHIALVLSPIENCSILIYDAMVIALDFNNFGLN